MLLPTTRGAPPWASVSRPPIIHGADSGGVPHGQCVICFFLSALLAVSTTGRDSSGIGLTAAINHDADSGSCLFSYKEMLHNSGFVSADRQYHRRGSSGAGLTAATTDDVDSGQCKSTKARSLVYVILRPAAERCWRSDAAPAPLSAPHITCRRVESCA